MPIEIITQPTRIKVLSPPDELELRTVEKKQDLGGGGGTTSPSIGGVSDFLSLSDTPDSYIGQALLGVRVNASETGLEFSAAASGNFQPLDADLTAIAALSTQPFGRGSLEMANAISFRNYIGASDGSWASITGKPTTLAGYGITDAQPIDDDLTSLSNLTGTNTIYYRSGANTWSPVTIGGNMTFSGGVLDSAGTTGGGVTSFNTRVGNVTSQTGDYTFAQIASKPTTLVGYGITDAQPLDSDLTAIANLTGTNTIYYRSGVNTWTAVTMGPNMTFVGGVLDSTGGGGAPVNITTTSPITGGPITGTGTLGLDVGVDFNWSVPQTVTITDAATNQMLEVFRLRRQSTFGATATGFGARLSYILQTNPATNRAGGTIDVAWSNATDASRTSYMDFLLLNNAVFAGKMRLFGSGGLNLGGITDPTTGVFNAATGFKVGNVAPAGNVLRGTGIVFVPAVLSFGDLGGALTPTQGGLPAGGNIGDVLVKSVTGTDFVSAWQALGMNDLTDGPATLDNIQTIFDYLAALNFGQIQGQISESQLPDSVAFANVGEGGFIFFDQAQGQSAVLKTAQAGVLGATVDLVDFNPTGLIWASESEPGAFTVLVDPANTARNLHSLAGAYPGRVVRIVNSPSVGNADIIVVNGSTLGTATLRFATSAGGNNQRIGGGGAGTFVYHGPPKSRWVSLSNALNLTAVTPGTYGDGTHVGQFTVDSNGRITAASSVAITGAGGTTTWGSITGTLSSQTDLQAALNARQPLDGQLTSLAALVYAPGQFIRVNAAGTDFELASAGAFNPAVDSLFTAQQSITLTTASNTEAVGLVLQNAGTATSLNQYYSPGLYWFGSGYHGGGTAGAQPIEYRLRLLPVQASGITAGGFLGLQSRIANGAYVSNWRSYTSGGFTVGGINDPTVGFINAANGFKINDTLLPFNGGTTGQVLTKSGPADYAWTWVTPAGGIAFDPTVDNLFTASQSITPTLAANTEAPGLQLRNTGLATNSTTVMYSPALHWLGSSWVGGTTNAAQSLEYRLRLIPTVGTTSAAGYLGLQRSLGGAAFLGNWRAWSSGGFSLTGTADPGAGVMSADAYKVGNTLLHFEGGATGAVLTKVSGTDYDWAWTTIGAGNVSTPGSATVNQFARWSTSTTIIGADLVASNITDSTARGRGLMTLPDLSGVTFTRFNVDNSVTQRTAAETRTDLGLVIGTNVQAWDADLDALAALTGNSKFAFRSSGGAWVVRGLGTGLSDDGTNINSSGGSTVRVIGATWNGNGAVLTTAAAAGYVTVPYSGTITGWSISVDTGTCTIKTWKVANGTAVPTSGNSISTSGVSISTGTHIRSSTVTDFTSTAVTAGDILRFEITAVASATIITFGLEIT